MSYYRGDYYRGDGGNYYRGDPFLPVLGALAAGAVKKVAGKAVKWVGKQTVGGLIGKAAATTAAAAAVPAVVQRVTGGGEVIIRPENILPGGQPFVDVMGAPRKYRRMNPLNPKALKRSLRRVEGFEKFARKTMRSLYKPGSVRKFKKATAKRS